MKAPVPVWVGGKKYLAYRIDGVLRFRENAVVRDLANCGQLNLGQVAVRVEDQSLPLRDVVEFWMLLGYSVDALADVFDSLAISTPEWTRPGKRFSKRKP